MALQDKEKEVRVAAMDAVRILKETSPKKATNVYGKGNFYGRKNSAGMSIVSLICLVL
jgi:hypothetical protein